MRAEALGVRWLDAPEQPAPASLRTPSCRCCCWRWPLGPWAHATPPGAHLPAAAGLAARQARRRAAASAAGQDSDAEDSANLSASARRIYDFGRPRLLQVRTLLRDQDSQASVGSGSLVGPDGLILTNYHVVSQVALEPQRYRLNFQTVDGVKGALQLIAFDVVHDLALVRMAKPPADARQRAARSSSAPPPRRWRRASASSRWAIRWTSASPWSRARTTAWSSAASCRRSCSPARSTRA